MNKYPNLPDVLHERLAGAAIPILDVLDSWCGIRNGQLIPHRDDFDPASVSRHLRKIYLYRYEPSEEDFVCRLAGEAINDAWQERLKGKRLVDVVSKLHHAEGLARWRAVIEEPRIQYGVFSDMTPLGDNRVGERMILPLRGSSGRGEYVLGVADYRVSQADRSWINPVWDDVIQIACVDIPMKEPARA